MNEQTTELIKSLIKKGFSTILALAGTALIYLGCIEKARMPEALIGGIIIIAFSIIYLITETYLKQKSIKNTQKLLNEYLKKGNDENEILNRK